MASLNEVKIIGHLGRDPEIRSFQNGGKVCNLRVATTESWRDKASGERKERTEWHSVAITNEGLVGIAEKYLKKGSKVYLCGALRTRKWQDQAGADRYAVEIVLAPFNGDLILLDARGSRDGGEGGSSGGGYDYGGAGSGGGSSAGGRSNDFDDEIPF